MLFCLQQRLKNMVGYLSEANGKLAGENRINVKKFFPKWKFSEKK